MMIPLYFSVLLLSSVLRETSAACQLREDDLTLRSWQGRLESPEHSTGMYPDYQNCKWDIRVSEGSRVNLTILTFDLEDGYYKNGAPSTGENMNCNDVVKVVDSGKQVLFEGCQNQGEGRSFTSSGNRMTVYFISDEANGKAGFTATYEGVCQSVLADTGYLESPGYPDPPPDGVDCQWEVTSKLSQVLYIRPDPNVTDNVLPDCDSGILEWNKTSPVPGATHEQKELCSIFSKIVTQSDVILTYQPTPTKQWKGRLFLDYSSQSGCDQYCEHGFPCYSPRKGDIGDYQCLCEEPYLLGHNCEIYTDPCLAHNCSHVGLCTSVPDSANFTCACDPGYTGTTCENQVDPCQDVVCLNGGNCYKVNVTLGLCDCLDGFESPDCHEPPSPCLSLPCMHSGTCMRQGIRNFTCLCAPLYTGANCSILLENGHCQSEVDDTAGSHIKWSHTEAGHHDIQPCPAGSTGWARRNCIPDEHAPTLGLWRRPDLSECVSPALIHLTKQSKSLRQTGVEEDILYNVTRHLDNVTSELTSEGLSQLYPGDLLGASDVLEDISQGVINALSVDQDPPGLAKHFTSSIGNILNPATLDVWKNARVNLVEDKVASVLTSAQRFAENLVRRQRGVSVISGPASAGVTSALLSSTVDTVELMVSEWGDEEVDGQTSFFSPSLTSDLVTPTASISLPSDLLRIARAEDSERPVKIYTGRFSSIAPLLSLKECRYSRENEENATRMINSDVISAEVLEHPPGAFSKLANPIVLTFQLKDQEMDMDLKKYCVFMNMTASDSDSRWLTSGCDVYESNTTHVTCHCYHLTNFAVLLDVYDNADDFDKANSAALSYISYIGGTLSILACVVVIVVFEYFRLGSDRVRIHEQLAASIIAVQVLFLVGVGNTTADHSTPVWACKTVAILLHYALTAMFCWMLVEGIHIYVMLVKVFKRGSHIRKYTALGWGVPLIVVGISVAVFFDKYGNEDLCWLDHELLLVCFVPTVSLVVTINTVILVLVLRVMLQSLHSTAKANTDQQGSLKMSLKASAVLLPLLGLTWILGFLAVDLGREKVMVYVFTYLFTVCNSFQGLLFFLFHCLLNVDVHNAYERRYRQRKRASSSLDTQTRKNSEASFYLPDSSPNGKSTTKTTLTDISFSSRRPSLAHNRFLLFDRRSDEGWGADPTHLGYDTDNVTSPRRHSASFRESAGRRHKGVILYDDMGQDASSDVTSSAFDDVQNSDTDKIWRRYSLTHDPPDSRFNTIPVLRRSPSYPSRPERDVTAFVTSMHDVLDRPSSKYSVRFSED